ncbi:MAG: sensor domain-containing diguanylate cyclase [Woeseiaceae bacterium]
MLPISDTILSADILLTWHECVRAIAYGLLGGLGLFALLQFAAADKNSVLAKLSSRRSLRSRLMVGLGLVGTIPVLALVLLLTERSAHLRMERLSVRINETAGSMAYAIDRYLDKHVAGINSVALAISAGGNLSSAAASEALLLHHAVYTDFLTMLTADAKGNIVSATNFMSGPLRSVQDLAGHNVSDREYFIAPMSDGQSFISNPFQGRSLGSDPIVAVSAALTDVEGRRIGIVEGSMDLGAFEAIDKERPHIDGAVMVVVDRENNVVYATEEAGLIPLESIADSPMVTEAALHPGRESYDFVHGNTEHRHRHMGTYANTYNGWRVYLRVPVDQVTEQMLSDYRVGGWLLLIACAISLLLARAIVRRVSQSVRDMNSAIKSFSIDGAGDEVYTPTSAPQEFRPVFRAMRARSSHLRKAHKRLSKSIDAGEALRRELTKTVALKEVEIAERTVELEEANQKLSGLSRTDALTGIPNRRAFDAFEQRAWRLAARDQTPIAVILMDIDFFKIYNDSLGHQAGDECLRDVAEALSLCATRPLDLVARYGGEEFVAVLGGSTIHDALIVGERMRQATEGLQIEHPGSSHEVVTVSVGISSTIPTNDKDSESVVKAADEALYYAKAAGRNCVVFRRDEEYVTYDSDDVDLGATGVIQILAGKRA